MSTLRCSFHKVEHPIEAFARAPGVPRGFQYYCKAATNENARVRHAKRAAEYYARLEARAVPAEQAADSVRAKLAVEREAQAAAAAVRGSRIAIGEATGNRTGNRPLPMEDEPTAPGVPPPSLTRWGEPDDDPPTQSHSFPFAERLFVIGDLHVPRQHPSAVDFLAAVKKEFDPDVVVQVGDETDFHGLSFHSKDPNLPGASDELRGARLVCGEIEKLFPRMWIIDSNHGSLLYRKASDVGIPEDMLKGYNAVLRVGNGWQWARTVRVRTARGEVLIEHGEKATARTMARRYGMSVIQGHRHGEGYAELWNNSIATHFAMQTGCMIDRTDRGFWYGRNYKEHPVISSGLVLNGEPYIVRLNEKKSGRWDWRLPLARAAA